MVRAWRKKHGSSAPPINANFELDFAALTCRARYRTLPRMSLIRGLFWLVLFVFFTFCFVVLFEYGTHDFANGFQKEFERAKSFVTQAAKPAEKKSK